MAMNDLERLRLYLRDQGTSPRFSDEDLADMLTTMTTVEGAAALGWLLIAAEAGEASVSAAIGNTSESYGQPTERYKVAMAMHHYWKDQDPADNFNGLWMEIVPDPMNGAGGIVAELMEHQQWLSEYYETWDLSRLGF